MDSSVIFFGVLAVDIAEKRLISSYASHSVFLSSILLWESPRLSIDELSKTDRLKTYTCNPSCCLLYYPQSGCRAQLPPDVLSYNCLVVHV